MEKSFSVILINAKERVVETIQVATLGDLQAAVEGYIEDVGLLLHKNAETGAVTRLYVNEEGRFRKFDYGFQISGLHVVGNGLVVGIDDEGDTAPAGLTVDEVAKRVVFNDLTGVAILNTPPRFIPFE